MLQKFAEDLKSLRKSKNLSLTEMSASTKISQTSFQKIENGDFTFQPETYIRAFIKQYAIALDIEPDELIKDYDLAKAGKYTPKFAHEEKKTEEKKIEEKPAGKTEQKTEAPVTEKKQEPKEIKLPPPPAEKQQVKESKQEEKKPEKKASEEVKEKGKEKTGEYPYRYTSEKGESSGFDSSILKTLGTIAVILLICVGLYFLVTSLFFNGSKKDKVEVQRQNFDEVVKENEKKILGKRTEEEIQDSIRKAEEEQRRLLESAGTDTLNLVITSTGRGSLTIAADSVNISKPEIVQFGRNEIGEWKARKFFIISSPNTGAFIAKINGNTIVFPDKVADKVRIGRDGIIK